MLTSRSLRRGSFAGLALALAVTPLFAQAGEARSGLRADGSGGWAVPAGAFSDYVDGGPSTALRLSYWMSPRLAIELGGTVDFLDGRPLAADRALPDVKLWHFTAGLGANALPADSRLSLRGNVGLGFTTFDSDFFQVGSLPETAIREQYFTAEGGLRVGYDLFESLGAFIEGRAYWMRPETMELALLTAHDPASLEPIDEAWVLPVRVGVEVAF